MKNYFNWLKWTKVLLFMRAHDQNLPIDSDVEHMVEVMECRECKDKTGK